MRFSLTLKSDAAIEFSPLRRNARTERPQVKVIGGVSIVSFGFWPPQLGDCNAKLNIRGSERLRGGKRSRRHAAVRRDACLGLNLNLAFQVGGNKRR